MAAHTFHERIDGDPILFDHCPRCEQIAQGPLVHAVGERFAQLWARMVQVERDGGSYITVAEKVAGEQLYYVALMIEREIPILDPWRWPWAFRPAAAEVTRGSLRDS
jgi:hypothetical protein